MISIILIESCLLMAVMHTCVQITANFERHCVHSIVNSDVFDVSGDLM